MIKKVNTCNACERVACSRRERERKKERKGVKERNETLEREFETENE